jgi:DHA1 family tetracycline resistance protein-like MFS transporter
MAAVLLFGYIAQQSLMNVWVIYADYRYHWTDRTVGFSLAAVGIFSGLVGGLLVKPVVQAIGERGTILLGLIFGSAGYAAFGLSRTGLLFWCAIPFFCLMSLVWPSAQSLMTHQVGPSEQGQLQGAINSLRGIAGLIGPGLFTYIFSRSIGENAVVHEPGMPFYVAALMLLVSLVITQRVTQRSMPASSTV